MEMQASNYKENKLRWYPQQPQRFIFYKSFWSVLRNQALETLWTCWNLTWPCTKDSPNLLRDLLSNLLRDPLNLTWLCTKASRNLLRNILRNLVEPNLALHQSLPRLLRNLLRNPVARDLALHQSLPDLLRNLLRNPVDLIWPCTKDSQNLLRDLLSNLLRDPLNLTWLCTKACQELLHASPEPSPEPCWTWPGASQTFSGTFSGTLLKNSALCIWCFVLCICAGKEGDLLKWNVQERQEARRAMKYLIQKIEKLGNMMNQNTVE